MPREKNVDCGDCKHWDYVEHSGFSYCKKYESEIAPFAWDKCKGKSFELKHKQQGVGVKKCKYCGEEGHTFTHCPKVKGEKRNEFI